jgi:hypothetical protein
MYASCRIVKKYIILDDLKLHKPCVFQIRCNSWNRRRKRLPAASAVQRLFDSTFSHGNVLYSLYSSVDTEMGYELDSRGLIVDRGNICLYSTTPESALGSSSLMTNGHGGLFIRWYSYRGMKLNSHLHIVKNVKPISSLPHKPSWYSTEIIKHGEMFTV